MVLVYVKEGHRYNGIYRLQLRELNEDTDGELVWSDWGTIALDDVTHWMPLPAPPAVGAPLPEGTGEAR